VARGIVADLAGVLVGDGRPVTIVGVVNVSPESFHPGSVYQGEEAIVRAALGMVEAGAALIDVGARSTAPYLDTAIDDATETARLARAVELLAAKLPVPISADTSRLGPARAALAAGASVINDVSTLRDPLLARLVAARSAGLILMASPAAPGAPEGAAPCARDRASGVRQPRGVRRRSVGVDHAGRGARLRRSETGRRTPAAPSRAPSPVGIVKGILAAGLRRAHLAGILPGRIVVDPGVGFFRDSGMVWHVWDVRVLKGLGALRGLGRPVGVGVSRKSFIGAIVDREDTAERLAGSLGATAIAVVNGAALVRTHDVAETRDVIRVAERLRPHATGGA
jgi:dihydropteroate synthase